MNPAEHPNSAQWWEEKLVNDYRNYRWSQLMEPICEKMRLWKEGKISYAEMDEAIETCHHHLCEVRNLLNQRQDRLVMLIQWLDREWFMEWVKAHTPPPDVRLAPPIE